MWLKILPEGSLGVLETERNSSNFGARSQMVRPCLRWAGSKRHLVQRILELIPFPSHRYFEPMVGAGHLFFSLRAPRSIISDANAELVNFYCVLRDSLDNMWEILQSYGRTKEDYYRVRNLNPKDPIERGARFLYLNSLCWNGLYRVNSQGQFNVPYGNRRPEMLWDFENLRACSMALATAEIRNEDFEALLEEYRPGVGDVVFLDPPYPRGSTCRKRKLGFNEYTVDGFTLEDHRRLARVARRWGSAGATIVVTEASHPEIIELFGSDFKVVEVESHSTISGKSIGRRTVSEAILVYRGGGSFAI